MKLYVGDCREIMKDFPDNSIDSIVTDPPYELGFMGKSWDRTGIANDVTVWRECLRVLKPGGHLLAFGGTRTYHRMASAVEDAGFEVRDQIMWIYGSGFPKSLDVSKAIDKAAGVERQVVGVRRHPTLRDPNKIERTNTQNHGGNETRDEWEITEPATEDAKQWQGWGTALKPAHEPIVLARKPLVGTVAENVLEHGTGALNIDGCRVEPTGERLGGGGIAGKAVYDRPWMHDAEAVAAHTAKVIANAAKATELGRWPANVIHDGDDEVIALFPESKGQQGDVRGTEPSGVTKDIYGKFAGRVPAPARKDSGSAARFFYCSKASKKDRNNGCENVVTWESADLSQEMGKLLQLLKGISDDITHLQSDTAWSTILFGKNTMDQSLTDIRFITKTVSKLITELKTSNFSQHSITSACILAATRTLMEAGLNLAENVETIRRLSQNTTNEKTASALGAVAAVLQTLWKISEKGRRGNAHSTVKPTDLMRYLCRLITPPGGVVLDPFMGSGSTGKAAILEGFDFIGIELSSEYVKIAEARIGQ